MTRKQERKADSERSDNPPRPPRRHIEAGNNHGRYICSNQGGTAVPPYAPYAASPMPENAAALRKTVGEAIRLIAPNHGGLLRESALPVTHDPPYGRMLILQEPYISTQS
ncbi:MAG: hypothetical protein ACRERU_00965 [Methylococcales bacterium]